MHVGALWRYPVKSMQGEPCEDLHLAPGGAVGDRSFGVLDVGSGTIVSAKRDGRLLESSARFWGNQVLVRLPGEEELAPGSTLDDRLTNWLGRPVRLIAASNHGVGTFECPEDFESDDSEVVRWQGINGSFVDQSELHLLSTPDLMALAAERPELQWDVRRFRPNVVVETEPGAWGAVVAGQRIRIGEAEIEAQHGCSRCLV